MFYLHIGKLCRYVPLPEGFNFPVTQILGMWTLFSKYEGVDSTGQFYKYTSPTVVDKKYQVGLFFGKDDKKLQKIAYGELEFKVEQFDTCTQPLPYPISH